MQTLFILGGIFSLAAVIILIMGIVQFRRDSKDPEKDQVTVDNNLNLTLIFTGVCITIGIVLTGMGLYRYLEKMGPSPYAPPPTVSPAATKDEELLDQRIAEGWFLQPRESNRCPDKDPCVINKKNLAQWGLKHGASTANCDDNWVLRKHAGDKCHQDAKIDTEYRGIKVTFDERALEKPTLSPAFFARH